MTEEDPDLFSDDPTTFLMAFTKGVLEGSIVLYPEPPGYEGFLYPKVTKEEGEKWFRQWIGS